MISNILLWLGLTIVIALTPFLSFLGISVSSDTVIAVGAVIMLIGIILLLMGR